MLAARGSRRPETSNTPGEGQQLCCGICRPSGREQGLEGGLPRALTHALRGRLGGTFPQHWKEAAARHTLHSCVTTPWKVQSGTPLCGVLPAYPPLSPDMLTVLRKSFGVSLWLRSPEWKAKSLSGGLSVAGERGRGGRSSRRGGDLKGGRSIPSLGVAASPAPLLPRPWHEGQPWH